MGLPHSFWTAPNTEEDILKQSELLNLIRGEINEIEFD